MKARIYILVFLSFLFVFMGVGCSTPKKLTSNTKEVTSSEEKKSETAAGEIYNFVDTTRKAGLEVTYTKIEFYRTEPEKPAGPEESGSKTRNRKPEATGNPESSPKEKQPPDRGSIKSIEQLTIKQTDEEAGISESRESNTSTKEEEARTNTTVEADVTEKPAADPYRFRYIFWILIIIVVVGIVGYFSLRKTKLFTSIASFFKRIF